MCEIIDLVRVTVATLARLGGLARRDELCVGGGCLFGNRGGEGGIHPTPPTHYLDIHCMCILCFAS